MVPVVATMARRGPTQQFLAIFASVSAFSLETSALTPSMNSVSGLPRVIDSHLHVWASKSESATFPYVDGQAPPDVLADRGSTAALLREMANSGVDGALVVQPINHKYDHSYVASAIEAHPDRLKGMLLHNPSLSPEEAVSRLEDLVLRGFVGVRFNPYLWSDGSEMSEEGGCGLAVYKRCAQLNIPVGVMCFKGLELHYEDILRLLESSPETTLILDHFGFTGLDETGDEAFKQLLSLSKHANVVVKISAMFRIAGPGSDPFPYEGVKERRFKPLLEAFGAERLMFGSDFPFVLQEEGGYKGAVDVVGSWANSERDRHALMGGTAERLFGPWVVPESNIST